MLAATIPMPYDRPKVNTVTAPELLVLLEPAAVVVADEPPPKPE